jgi:hypothetical protein
VIAHSAVVEVRANKAAALFIRPDGDAVPMDDSSIYPDSELLAAVSPNVECDLNSRASSGCATIYLQRTPDRSPIWGGVGSGVMRTENDQELGDAYRVAFARFEEARMALDSLAQLDGEAMLAGIDRLREARQAAAEARLRYEALLDAVR